MSLPIDSLPLSGAAGDSPRRLPAWLMSCLLHAILLFVAGLLIRNVAGGGAAGPEPERVAGIVLTQNIASRAEYFSPEQADRSGTASEPAASEAAAQLLPAAEELPVATAGVLPAAGGLRASVGGAEGLALPSAAELTGGLGPSKSLGGDSKAYLFGLEGEGSLFVYVFDRSDSMNGFEGRPLAAAKAELINSVRGLAATNQFQIIFYNNDVTAFNPDPSQPPRLMFADDGTKTLAEQFVRRLSAFGGTEHMGPLQLALRMGPDVVFFLTDAAEPQLSPAQLERLRRLNRGSVIHAIEFGVGPRPGGDNFLMKLARQNDGQHTYVDVTQLPGRR